MRESLVPAIGERREKSMKTPIIYEDAPADARESFDRAVLVPTFEMTPEGIKDFIESRKKLL